MKKQLSLWACALMMVALPGRAELLPGNREAEAGQRGIGSTVVGSHP
jgi:hypothetical protein